MNYFVDYRDQAGSTPTQFYKTTLFQSDRLMLGLNCLESGQNQPAHSHDDQDKFYFVVEGEGEFMIGEQRHRAGPGVTIWAPAGVKHGVTNDGVDRLVLLVGIAPSPV